MPVDLKYLREHYASLSDEALAAIDRTELVREAQQCYDQEFARRKESRPVSERSEPVDLDQPDWLDEAAEVYSQYDRSGAPPADDVVDARDVLEAAGIPCHLDLIEEEKISKPPPTHRWRVMVPDKLSLRARSVLARDIFNSEFEAGWRSQLEMFSDEELREMVPQVAYCGLFDRVERVIKAYEEEIARRGL